MECATHARTGRTLHAPRKQVLPGSLRQQRVQSRVLHPDPPAGHAAGRAQRHALAQRQHVWVRLQGHAEAWLAAARCRGRGSSAWAEHVRKVLLQKYPALCPSAVASSLPNFARSCLLPRRHAPTAGAAAAPLRASRPGSQRAPPGQAPAPTATAGIHGEEGGQ